MAWYWIVGYIAAGFVAYGVMYFIGEVDQEEALWLVFLWPLLIPVFMFVFACWMIERFADAIEKKLRGLRLWIKDKKESRMEEKPYNAHNIRSK